MELQLIQLLKNQQSQLKEKKQNLMMVQKEVRKELNMKIFVDTDDDDPSVMTAEEDTAEKWSDAEEEACGTLWWSALSEPNDYDGDGICDELDDDVDGNGWSDAYQCECSGLEDSDAWSMESIFGTSGLTSFS